ncbi:MAG: acyl-ACP--UDP-N-acetylglucosamine O-acyltransferase [bacterium]|nr:acyl-ACP--UDP-N-acetylglucosamine O-acyltransferase [Candidatus Minthenecus merdequi]
MKQLLAYVHPDAQLASNVVVEPFVTIDKNVKIGAGTHIGSNVTILEGTTIGDNCNIFPGAVIGAIPQDLKFRGEKTEVIIGNNCNIRECVTIHRGTASRGRTIIGNNCLIMAYCHVAHDCILNNNIIMSNCTQLAGECVIGDYAVIGGGTLVHQFTHIGCHSMIQGGSRINKDIPPYITAGRDPITYAGINSIGLRRRGYSNDQINTIQDIYRLIFNSGMNVSDAVERIVNELPATAERDEIILFIRESSRGILRSGR